MENLFETITKTLPQPTTQQKQQLEGLQGKKTSLKDLVIEWQKNPSKEGDAEMLSRLKPTINAAMNSYAPGMENQLAIKAAKITLDALRLYKPDMGADPTTFVFHNLKRLNRYNSQRNNIIPQSEAAQAELKYISDLSSRFEDDKGREPSMAELADMSGYSTKKITKLLEGNTIVSEASTIAEDSGKSTFTTKDLTDDDYWEYVYSSVQPIDQKIMEWTSGYHSKKILSNNDIASKLKITPAAVSQRKNKIMQMMSDVRGLL